MGRGGRMGRMACSVAGERSLVTVEGTVARQSRSTAYRVGPSRVNFDIVTLLQITRVRRSPILISFPIPRRARLERWSRWERLGCGGVVALMQGML